MTTTQQDVKALKEDIAYLKELLSDAEGTINDGVNRSIRATKREMRSLAKNVGKSTRAFIGDKQEQLLNTKTAAEDSIRERPFAATAAAFAGGVLLTMLLRRK